MREQSNFTVITNPNMENKVKHREENNEHTGYQSYQTNPLKEQFMRFHNNEVGHKFSVEDLLKW